MLVVKLEIWHGGDKRRVKDLGTLRIERVEDSQMPDIGGYVVVGDLKDESGSANVTVEVQEFPRKFGAWELVRRALDAINRKRTPRGPH
jgi:hypothetical protein